MLPRRSILACLAAGVAVLATGPVALGAELPPRNAALLLLRVLAYDRNIARRAGETASVLILARQGDRASEERAARLAEVFEDVAREVVVAGLPVKGAVLPLRDAAALDARLERGGAALVVVDEALAGMVPDLVRVTRRHGALTAGPSRELAEAGLAVAVVARQGRAGIIVNLRAARLERAELDAALLAVAELIRE